MDFSAVQYNTIQYNTIKESILYTHKTIPFKEKENIQYNVVQILIPVSAFLYRPRYVSAVRARRSLPGIVPTASII